MLPRIGCSARPMTSEVIADPVTRLEMSLVGKLILKVTIATDDVGGADGHHRQQVRQPDAAMRQVKVEIEQPRQPDDRDRAEEQQDPGQGLVEGLVLARTEERKDPQPGGDRADKEYER